MKAFTTTLLSLALISTTAVAKDDKPIEAQLVSVTISKPLPKGLKFQDRPMGYREGASLTFFFQGADFVSVDRKSFDANGWDIQYQPNIARSGKTGSITVYNRKFQGIQEELEIDTTVNVLVGSETKTKTIKLKKGAEPIKLSAFTVELQINEKGDRFMGGNGVKVVGDHKSIKSIALIRDGKEIRSNGYGSSGEEKTFSFRDIKDGDEVKIVYYSKLATKTIKLYK